MQQIEQAKLKKLIELFLQNRRQLDTPLCPRFGECGSCSFTNYAYEDVFEAKLHAVEHILTMVNIDFSEIDVQFFPSLEELHYRGRMDYAITHDGRLGLKKRGSWHEVLAGHTCIIASKAIERVFAWLDKNLSRFEIEGYDRLARRGVFSFAVIQAGTQDIMVSFVTRRETWKSVHKLYKERIIRLAQQLFSEIKEVVSINVAVNDSVREDSSGEVVFSYLNKEYISRKGAQLLEQYTNYGPFILNQVNDFVFPVAPLAFFQPNLYTAGMLQDIVSDLVMSLYPRKVLDLFGGIGFLSAQVAFEGKEVYVVEVSESIFKMRELFLHLNSNLQKYMSFIVTDAYEFDIEEFVRKHKIDVLILDPPRRGLTKKMQKRLKNIATRLKGLIYVSCNVKQFAIEYNKRFKDSYKVEKIVVLDQFPFTPHVEVIFLLTPR